MSAPGLALVLVLGGTTATPPPKEAAATITPAPDPAEASPSCLEADLAEGPRRKGVQAKDFLKKNRAQLAALGGLYASDVVSSTWLAGGALSFFPSEDLGLEVLVSHSPVKFRLEEPFSGFDRDRRFVPGSAWQALAGLVFVPMHAKFRTSEERIVHGDLFVVAGAGRTEHASVQGLTWQAGAGVQFYLARFVSLRIDLRDFVMAQEVLGRGRISHNVGITGGIGLWTP